MITWIQTVLQKHHKIVFSILLVAIIIAFVFTIGSVPFLGDRYRGSSENDSMFCGYDLSNPNTAGQFQTCAFYDAILNNMPIRTREQFEILMLSQVYMMSVARDLGMRQVSESELKSYIESRTSRMDAYKEIAELSDFNAEREFVGLRRFLFEKLLSSPLYIL